MSSPRSFSAIAVSLALLLTACATNSPPALAPTSLPTPPSHQSTATPEPTPATPIEPTTPADALVVIRATTTDSDGAPVSILATLRQPQPVGTEGPTGIAEAFTEACASPNFALEPGDDLAVFSIETSPAGRKLKQPLGMYFGEWQSFVAVGEGVSTAEPAEGSCSGRVTLTSTGSSQVIIRYPDDGTDWTGGLYGFFVKQGSAFADCEFEVTELAGITEELGWSEGKHPTGCAVGLATDPS